MRKIVKKILCLVLAVSCSITMLPSTAFADFTTSSGTTSGSGKKYDKLVNLVNVGYRISLYYEGKDEVSGKQYFPSIAFNETSDKPLMRRFATEFSPENYVASKSMDGKISATYFRDKAAQKASILVLNNTGNSFGTIYQLKPTSNYKASTMTWDDVDESRICKKNSDNKVYKLLNEYTDGGLKKFQEKSWLGTKQGASAIVNTEDLDKIDKVISKNISKKTDIIKAFKSYADEDYWNRCIADPNNVFIQIEPVAIFSGVSYGSDKGFMATWSETRWACSGTKYKNFNATKRGCYSWRKKSNSPLDKAFLNQKKSKVLKSSTPKDVDVKVVYYGTSYDNANNRACAAASIMGTLYNDKIWGHSTQLTASHNTCSGVAYYGCGDVPPANAIEDVSSVSLLYTGELDEDSMNIENGKWTQANALAEFDVKNHNQKDYVNVRANFNTRNTNNIELTKYIDYVNQNVSKKYGEIYTYAKGTDYKKEVTKAKASAGYSNNSDTTGYNLVGYYNYLIDNKKANVKTSTMAKNINDATEHLISKKDAKGSQALKADWSRAVVGSGSDGLNAGFTVQFDNIRYNDGSYKTTEMFNIVSKQILKPAYKDLKADYGISRILEYPYTKVPTDKYNLIAVSKANSDNVLATDQEKQKDRNLLARKSIYSESEAKAISTSVNSLNGTNTMGTQAYYLEGVAFKGLLGSATTQMTKLGQLAMNKKYAMNILVGAKIADVKSYYTWATYDFTHDKIASKGTTEKTYDITSYGLFPLGESGQKGIKRVIIVPNKGASKKNSDMAISETELEKLVEDGCRNASEDQSESEILTSIWKELRTTLKSKESQYNGSLRQHFNELLDQYSDEESCKHNGSESAAVGFYQNKDVEMPDNNGNDETLDDEGTDYVNKEVDESENPEDKDTMKEDANSSGTGETDSDYESGYANKTFADNNIKLSEKDFMDKLNKYLKDNGVEEITYEAADADLDGVINYKVGTEVKDVANLASALASGDFVLTDAKDNVVDLFDNLDALMKVIDKDYKGVDLENKEEADYNNDGDVIDTDEKSEGIADTGKDIDNTIVNNQKNRQRGYTIIGIGYIGKRVKTAGIDLQPWELNYVYADLNSALNASNEGKVNDKTVDYETNAYLATLSSDSTSELHSKAKIWSYTGSRNDCADGHTDLTSETYYKPHSGLVSYATVSYVPSAAAWDNDDSLFTYNLIVSDETKHRSGSVDTEKNSNYTYSVNKDKLHADQDNDDTKKNYSLILYSKDFMNSLYGDTNRARYSNTDMRWSTWSRISKNFNNAPDYQTHYFTVNSLRETAYFSYVYNLIRYISGDEKVSSSIFNYTASENTNEKLKKDSAITDFVRDCLLMKTDNVPNLEVAHLSQSSDKVKTRNRQNKFNVPYYKGESNAKDYISEHITLNAYMQDDDDNIIYTTPNNVDILPANKNKTGNIGSIYHTFKTLMKGHPQSGCNQTIQWTHKVSTTLNVLSSEHCHKEDGEWRYWVSGTKDYPGYWSYHSYSADLSDVPTLCYHNRTIRGVMPDAFIVRSVDINTGVLGEEESDSQYNLDYGETIYKYVTEKMNMGLNNTKTGIIDSNGILKNDGKQDIAVEPSSTANETVESNTPRQGGDNSRIKTQFSSAYFDGEEKGNLSKTAFAYYPEVNMIAYAYGRGQKLGDRNSVSPYVVPTIGEVERASQGAGLYFMTTKSANYNGAVEKNSQLPNYFKRNGSDFVGTTMSDSVATGTEAQNLGQHTILFNSNTDKKQVIYAGSDVTVSGNANFSLNMYGYALDLISPEDGNDNMLTMQSATTDKYSTYAQSYNYIVADGSDIYQKWYETSNGTYKDILAAVKAENPVHNAKDNKAIMTARYNQWVKESTNLNNWSADYTLNVVGEGYNSKFTDFSATIGSIKTQDGKAVTEDISKQTDVYPLHIKNGEIVRTDSGYVAMINQIAMDYFGDTATDVNGTITLTNGVQVAKLKHYDAAEKLFKESDMGSSVKNAIESSSDDFNKSGSCFSNVDDKTARGNSLLGSTKNWYDEEVRTIVVRRFKTEPLYFNNITASDKIDYNTAPTSETTMDVWKGRTANWYLNLRFKDTDNTATSTLKKLGVELSKTTTDVNKGFQVVKDLYVDNASFIIPSATTDNMGW